MSRIILNYEWLQTFQTFALEFESLQQKMNEIKQMKDFAASNKFRELIARQMNPTVLRIEAECTRICNEIQTMRDRAEIIYKFETDRSSLEKSIRDLRNDLGVSNHTLAHMKGQNEINQSKLTSNMTTLKEEIESFHRILTRRQEVFQAYDKKINGMMDVLSKHQGYVNDRIYIFQQKFKELTRQTLQMTKTVKIDFDSSMTNNQILKSELVHKIKKAEEKEKIIDLYMSQREIMPKKIHAVHQDLKTCVRKNEIDELKKWQEKRLDQILKKTSKSVQKAIPQETQQKINMLGVKFAQIDELQGRIKRIQQLKHEIQKLNEKVESIQVNGDDKIAQIRVDTEIFQQKMIEVIDKKMETIEDNIEQIEQVQTQQIHVVEQSVEEKLLKLKTEIQQKIKENFDKQIEQLDQLRSLKTVDSSGQQVMISRQLQTAKIERQKIENQFKQIKSIADGLNNKLILFGYKITMCRSDIDIFVDSTNKELKKISDVRKDEEEHMEIIGKVLSQYMQSMMILTSLMLHEEKRDQVQAFVTYHDGLIFEFGGHNTHSIHYRRNQINVRDLKESLLYCLIHLSDEIISHNHILKWSKCKPSSFFNRSIKDNLLSRAKGTTRSQSLLLHSAHRKTKKHQVQQDNLFNFKIQSVELTKNGEQQPHFTLNANSSVVDKPKSQMNKRYKLKRHQQRILREGEEKTSFSTSRSHRKTKLSFV